MRARCCRESMQVNYSTLVERPNFLPEFSEWGALKGKKIAITGYRGILGSLLMKRLLQANICVEVFLEDITNGTAVSNWIRTIRPDAIFHLAAIVPLKEVEENPITAMRVNAAALLDVFEAINRYAPQCWLFHGSTSHVYASSAAVSEEGRVKESSLTLPISLYGATKLAGEAIVAPLAAYFETPLCIGRIFSYFHERQPLSFLVPSLTQRFRNAQPDEAIEVRDSNSIRDFLYAEMVVDALLFLYARRSSTTVNIGSGQATSVGDMAGAVLRELQMDISVQYTSSPYATRLVADIALLKSIIGLTDQI